MTEIDEPYTFGETQRVNATGKFTTRELARLMVVKSKRQAWDRQEQERKNETKAAK